MKKRDSIESAMHYHSLVFFIAAALSIFGIFALAKMNKDEFPRFTIRQGIIAAIYPGADAQEIETQVTKPLEEFLFSYEEIDKKKTHSITEDGIVYIYAELQQNVKRKDETWSKIRGGLDLFKKTSLPAGVLQIAVIDDFGNTSSMLLALESPNHTPTELKDCADYLCGRLRANQDIGRIKILGEQSEEIAVSIDAGKLARYGIDRATVMAILGAENLRSLGGSAGKQGDNADIKVTIPYRNGYEVGEQIVFSDPATSQTVKLKDIATIERRYPDTKRIEYYSAPEDKASCLIISMEMQPKHNIVEFGENVDEILKEASYELPSDIKMHRITDQPKVVDNSVRSFLRDILFSILVVFAVMLLLFPFKTAMVAATAVPICISICIGMMYAFGIELHTVTLAALITVLGMIVDNSVIVVDGYTNMLQTGHSKWYSAATSSKDLLAPTLIATLSISAMFFPLTQIITGPIGEFVQAVPWTITFAMLASFAFAFYVAPYLCTRYISLTAPDKRNWFEKIQDKFFDGLQNGYNRLLEIVFRHPWATLGGTLILIVIGLYLFRQLPVQMMPKADRDCFAVEIHLQEGSDINKTAAISDSLATILHNDPRVKSVTNFIGMSSPRFHATYAPQIGKDNYAQLIVNTTSTQDTKDLLREYTPEYENAFPDAYVRFKQLDYQAVNAPIEVLIKGDDYDELEIYADSLKSFMGSLDELMWVHSDYDQTKPQIKVELIPEEADRLGVTQAMLSLYMSSVFGGQTITSVWEKDKKVPVFLYCEDADNLDYEHMADLTVPTAIPGQSTTLGQIAKITPDWHHCTLGHSNGIRAINVSCDMRGDVPQSTVQGKISQWVNQNIPSDSSVKVDYGGLTDMNNTLIPQIALSIICALLVMFVVLLIHYKKISLSLLTLGSSLLCIFGAFLGLYVFNMEFSITGVLGIVSLIGIIVRNSIIMFEYADELRTKRHLSGKESAFEAGKRRMKPVFLTSATTALGVIPMITAGTALWMPMGVVICFGTLFTLPLIVTVLPVAYWKLYARK